MTPPNVLAETIKQVVKILKSPGCRKTPVFVNSLEIAVELSQSFAKDRYVWEIQVILSSWIDDSSKSMPDFPSLKRHWSRP